MPVAERTYEGELLVGTRVHNILYGGKDGLIVAITGIQRPSTCRSIGGIMCTGGSAEVDIVWEDGTESRRTSEVLLRTGVQWRILDGVATADEIAAMRGFVILETQRRADEAEAKRKAFNAAVARLQNAPEYEHLKQGCDEYSGKLAGSNIRIELKKAFPGIKFSVRKEHHGSLNIDWTDGPTAAEVKKITNKHESADFDASEDLEKLAAGPFNKVFGGSKYIFHQHAHSFKVLSEASQTICSQYGWDLLKVEPNDDGTAYIRCDAEDHYRKVYDLLEGR
jgi:Large polyvalent protein associated domain 30/Large polyvalent protein associated domain 29